MTSQLLTVRSSAELANAREIATVASQRVLGERAADVALVVSELVTNALQHGDGDARVEVEVTDREVLITVASTAAAPPDRSHRDVPAEQTTGRGLQIVERMADSMAITSDRGVVTVRCSFAK